MINDINITEEDIFKFVFSKESLSPDKRDYLENNHERFSKEINLCMELKRDSMQSEIKSITREVFNRIDSDKIIALYPKIVKPYEENGVKLAASSTLTEKPANSISFIDADSKYLIRVIKTEMKTLLYLFSDNKNKASYNIKIYPSEMEYRINDLSQPIEILEEPKIEKIIVE